MSGGAHTDMSKVLIIDDDAMVRNTIWKILARDGLEIVIAGDGAKGLASFRQGRPDLVITDIIMPEKEGIATILEMRRERPDAKIIAISGGGRIGSLDFLSMAKSFGAMAVIAKPFDPDEFLNCVRSCLAA
jgi:DNA-binding NtrC family response regulator